MTTIHIVTPCINSADTIDATIASIVQQNGPFRLRYHVQDGGSDDNTLEKLESWAQLLRKGLLPVGCQGIEFTYSKEPDRGMYDAICRGFAAMRMGPEDWMGWLNADDILAPGCPAVLAAVDAQLGIDPVQWITGSAAIRRDEMQVYGGERYINSEVLRRGLCDGHHWQFIQQEGTFFRARLWYEVDHKNEFERFTHAGDWNLWRVLAKHAELVKYPFPLGMFTRREGQLSQRGWHRYLEEIEEIEPFVRRQESLRGLCRKDCVQVLVRVNGRTGEMGLGRRNFNDERIRRLEQAIHPDVKEKRATVAELRTGVQGKSGSVNRKKRVIKRAGYGSCSSTWIDALLMDGVRMEDLCAREKQLMALSVTSELLLNKDCKWKGGHDRAQVQKVLSSVKGEVGSAANYLLDRALALRGFCAPRVRHPREYRYLFHHIPKCAGQAAIKAFGHWFDVIEWYREGWSEQGPGVFDVRKLGHRSILCGHFETPDNRVRTHYSDCFRDPGFRVITFVRDPLELAQSLYFYEKGNRRDRGNRALGSLNEFLLTHKNFMAFCLQCDKDTWRSVIDDYWLVGTTERMEKSLAFLARELWEPPVDVPTVNASERDETPDPEVVRIFFENNELDYTVYHYVRETEKNWL